MNEITTGAMLFTLVFWAWAAEPRVWSGRRKGFETESEISLRWPPAEPSNLKPGHALLPGATRLTCVGNSICLAITAQQLWLTIPIWVYAVAVLIAANRTLRMLRLIREDGGFRRTRNSMEKMLLWGPFTALVTLDVVIVLTAPIHLAPLFS